MFLLNSCLGLFSAARLLWHPFLRTYGVNLPSSLTTLLPLVLGFSPHLPVSVCGTGAFTLDSGFSRQCGISRFGTLISLRIRPSKRPADFPARLSTSLAPCFLRTGRLILLRPHISQTSNGSTGISTSCPSPTPFGLSLGPDLPWADEPSPGILRFSTVKILTSLSLLIPAFSLLPRPHVLTVMLHPTTVSSPTPSGGEKWDVRCGIKTSASICLLPSLNQCADSLAQHIVSFPYFLVRLQSIRFFIHIQITICLYHRLSPFLTSNLSLLASSKP